MADAVGPVSTRLRRSREPTAPVDHGSSLSPTVPQVPRNLTATDARTTKPWPAVVADQGFFSGGGWI